MTSPRSGFSLVEMLVSLAILGMTATLLLSGVSMAGAVWARAQDGVESGEEIALAQGLLRERVGNLFPETRFDDAVPYVDIRGGADSLSFLGAPAQAQPGMIRHYRLQLMPSGGLTLFSIDALAASRIAEPSAAAGWRADPLVNGVRTVDLAYFGVLPPDTQPRWRSRWINRPHPPELVRIRVSFAPEDKRVWPELLIRPATTIARTCRIDPLTQDCRRT